MEILMFKLVIQHPSILGHLLGHFSCPLGPFLRRTTNIEDIIPHPAVWGVRWVSAPKPNRHMRIDHKGEQEGNALT